MNKLTFKSLNFLGKMENLTNLLLSMNTMKKIPLELIKEISKLVLDKPAMKAVLGNDIDTLLSIYYFDKHLITENSDKLGLFCALLHAKKSNPNIKILKCFENSLKNEKPRRPKA